MDNVALINHFRRELVQAVMIYAEEVCTCPVLKADAAQLKHHKGDRYRTEEMLSIWVSIRTDDAHYRLSIDEWEMLMELTETWRKLPQGDMDLTLVRDLVSSAYAHRVYMYNGEVLDGDVLTEL